MDGGAMTWHGHMPYQAEWTEETRLVAFSVSSAGQGGLYCAFNTGHTPQTVTLPHWPGLVWLPVMDSGKVDMTPHQSFSFEVPNKPQSFVLCVHNIHMLWHCNVL